MATFPRTVRPRFATIPEVPGPHVGIGESGGVNLRAHLQVGRMWEEEWGDLRAGRTDVSALLSFIRKAYHTGEIFDVSHLALPGSGLAPLGTGGGVPLVDGASQSGASLVTDGWSNNIANVVRAGDFIRIAGLNPLYEIIADGTSNGSGQLTLSINPPIPVGSSPADNAVITRTSCVLRAFIYGPPTMPRGRAGVFLRGLKVRFREAV